ncbi:hypothetical protein PMEGAS67_56470 [Priestia megaterium]
MANRVTISNDLLYRFYKNEKRVLYSIFTIDKALFLIIYFKFCTSVNTPSNSSAALLSVCVSSGSTFAPASIV